jgi:hypothetical protein
MRLVITVDIVSTVPEQAESMFARTVVDTLQREFEGNTIIPEALAKGARFNTEARVGRMSIAVESDSPVIYGVRY